jgi:hypothetical protein
MTEWITKDQIKKKKVFENEKYLAETETFLYGQIDLTVTNKEKKESSCFQDLQRVPELKRILETTDDEEKIKICRRIIRS